ncbi:MAG: response regulator transcription factor [Rubrobacteraceae bacterium]
MIPMRVFVVASAPMTRAGLLSMLADLGTEVEVVGEAGALHGLDSEPALVEADVILVTGEDLLEEAALALSDDGAQALLVLSEDEALVSRLRTLSARGWGIVSQDVSPEELGAAISAVSQGLVVLPASMIERLPDFSIVVEEPSEPLTAREHEVLDLLGRGLSNRLIARELHVSEHTVKFHVSSLYAKLGVGNRAGAVSQGARRGLISL